MRLHLADCRLAAWVLAAIALWTGLSWPSSLDAQTLAVEDFEGDLAGWRLEGPEQFELLTEPDTSNQVLQLTPKKRDFAHALLAASVEWRDLRFEGRFLFPTEGDGYLGFIYNYQETPGRMDFGCIYVKSNGSYVRISPHYDGNPSWRLYEELRFDLEGDRRIETGTWYEFRLDVRSNRAELYIGDLSAPVVRFDLFANSWGAVGLEARPGGGEPVWVDDVRVSKLEPVPLVPEDVDSPASRDPWRLQWEVLGPLGQDAMGDLSDSDPPELADVPADAWRPIGPDPRGMLVTGLTTQFRSGDQDIAYLRASFEVAEGAAEAPSWLAVSSANKLDVLFNGYYRGTVAPERFVWSDYRSSKENPGARIPISPRAGSNELLLRVHGRRFAGGGLYAGLMGPP